MPPGCGGGVANFCGKTAGIRPELRRILSDKSRKPEFLPSGRACGRSSKAIWLHAYKSCLSA